VGLKYGFGGQTWVWGEFEVRPMKFEAVESLLYSNINNYALE
jgi:hypothetical protein